MTVQHTGRAEGERRKADAFATLESRREAVIRRARRGLLTSLLHLGEATIDVVRELVELPPGIGPKLFGAVPGPLAKAGIIRASGFAKTARPVGHARPVTVWVLADRAAAERWLRDHPESDPDDGDLPAADRQRFLFPLARNEPTPAASPTGAV